MNETKVSQYKGSFFRDWLFVCVIGSAADSVFGILAGGGGGYYIAGKLVHSFSIPAQSVEFFSDLLATVMMGLVAGAVESFFQWIVLRRFLSHANWWILAGISGSLIGGAVNRIAFSPSLESLSDAAFISLFCSSLVMGIAFVGLLKGFLEWLVLRKDFPNSTKWVGLRVITHLVVLPINFIDLWVRNTLVQTLGSAAFSLLIFGSLNGIIFAAITGPRLEEFIRSRQATD